jgi:hypothetical protein
VIPRTPRDIEPNDKVYKMLEDEERKARTLDEMVLNDAIHPC